MTNHGDNAIHETNHSSEKNTDNQQNWFQDTLANRAEALGAISAMSASQNNKTAESILKDVTISGIAGGASTVEPGTDNANKAAEQGTGGKPGSARGADGGNSDKGSSDGSSGSACQDNDVIEEDKSDGSPGIDQPAQEQPQMDQNGNQTPYDWLKRGLDRLKSDLPDSTEVPDGYKLEPKKVVETPDTEQTLTLPNGEKLIVYGGKTTGVGLQDKDGNLVPNNGGLMLNKTMVTSYANGATVRREFGSDKITVTYKDGTEVEIDNGRLKKVTSKKS